MAKTWTCSYCRKDMTISEIERRFEYRGVTLCLGCQRDFLCGAVDEAIMRGRWSYATSRLPRDA